MIRATFQFIPPLSHPHSDVQLNDRVPDASVGRSGDMVQVVTPTGQTLEFDSFGNVRYSAELSDDLSEKDLEEVFSGGIEDIKEHIDHELSDFRVCLLLRSTNIYKIYYKYKSEIERFSINEFGHSDLGYHEMGEYTIKISFNSAVELETNPAGINSV